MDWITICITGKRLADSGVFFFGGGGWGEEYSPNFYTGRLRPKVQPLTLLYSIFDRNDSPFVYFPLTNGSTPLTYLGYNLLKITESCQTNISLSVMSNVTKNKTQL